MSNSRKIIWSAFAIFMFIQVGISYWAAQNSSKILNYYFSKIDNLSTHIESSLHLTLYFTLFGLVLFVLSFIVFQMDGMKAKKQIARLEQDKNELKAKLFDMQEAKSSKDLPALKTSPQTEPRQEIGSAEETSSPDTE